MCVLCFVFCVLCFVFFVFFFFNDTATTEIYTLSLHDALPISWAQAPEPVRQIGPRRSISKSDTNKKPRTQRHGSRLRGTDMRKFILAAGIGVLAGGLTTTQVAGPLLVPQADDQSNIYEQPDLFGHNFELIPSQYVVEVDSAELIEAAKARAQEPSAEAEAAVLEEYGDLLFTVVNIGRHLGVSAEDALRGTNAKFVRRFEHMEAALKAAGLTPQSASFETLEAGWNAAKAAERAKG